MSVNGKLRYSFDIIPSNNNIVLSTWKKEDGILAWIVCLNAFISNVIVIGIDCSFGETIGSLITSLDGNASSVGLAPSFHSSMMFLFAYICSGLAKRFGFRLLITIGTVLCSTAYLLVMYVRNVTGLIVTYGILAGIGSGLLYTPGNIVCAEYFEKRRSIATGLATSGSGFGLIILPLLSNYLNNIYGYKGYFIMSLIMSPLTLIFALVLLPLNIDEYDKSADNDEIQPDEALPILQKECNGRYNENITAGKINSTNDVVKSSNCAVKIGEKIPSNGMVNEQTAGKIFLDAFVLLKDLRLSLYCIAHLLYELAYYTPLDFLPEMMVHDHGIDKNVKGTILSLMGLTFMIGKIVWSIIVQYLGICPLILTAVCMTCLAIGCFVFTFCTTYYEFIIMAMVHGFFNSAIDVLAPLTIVQIFSVKLLKDCFAMVMLAKTFGSVGGSPIAGCFYDITKQYYASFYAAGSFNLTAAFVCIVVIWLQYRKR